MATFVRQPYVDISQGRSSSMDPPMLTPNKKESMVFFGHIEAIFSHETEANRSKLELPTNLVIWNTLNPRLSPSGRKAGSVSH